MPNFLLCSSKYRLRKHDSFLRFALLLPRDINVNPDQSTVNNNKIPLNIFLFHNCDEPTMSSECDSSDRYKEHDDSK